MPANKIVPEGSLVIVAAQTPDHRIIFAAIRFPGDEIPEVGSFLDLGDDVRVADCELVCLGDDKDGIAVAGTLRLLSESVGSIDYVSPIGEGFVEAFKNAQRRMQVTIVH